MNEPTPAQTETSSQPASSIQGRLGGKVRAVLDEVQRWQNLISAMIALAAAGWAWQYTQRQIEVTRDQLQTAQVQLAIGRSEVVSRRAADMVAIRLKVRELVDQASGVDFFVGR